MGEGADLAVAQHLGGGGVHQGDGVGAHRFGQIGGKVRVGDGQHRGVVLGVEHGAADDRAQTQQQEDADGDEEECKVKAQRERYVDPVFAADGDGGTLNVGTDLADDEIHQRHQRHQHPQTGVLNIDGGAEKIAVEERQQQGGGSADDVGECFGSCHSEKPPFGFGFVGLRVVTIL